MRKIILCLLPLMFITSCDIDATPFAKQITKEAAKQSQENAMASVEIPTIRHYQERKTVAKWYKTWDTPSVMTYIYIVSYGEILGYYVCNGKPVSTQSYLIPEDYTERHGSSGNVVRQAQDLDGTYGSNNAGIRFFTASGVAVEWAGSGASYLFSNAKLPLNVPELGN